MSDVISALMVGVAHQQRGEVAQAEAIYADVLAREPGQPNALYLYGLLQLQDGRIEGAVQLLTQAARQRPDAGTWLHLARAHLAAGNNQAALDAADTVLATSGLNAPALHLRGTALNGLHRTDAALAALTQAAALDPYHAATWLNLGNACTDLDWMATAEAHIRRALALDPSMGEAHASLGFVLCSQGRYNEAIAACRAGLAVDPRSAEAHWNLATALLLTGDYAEGFREYEWHNRHRDFRSYYRVLPGPLWDGAPLTGQTLLVDANQGLGDTIQLVRYMPLLADRGARVILACSPALLPLLAGQPGLACVVSRAADMPHYDCWIDQMSLPRLLGTTPRTIPGGAAYLTADPARRQRWRQALPQARIGLCWAGNPLHHNDRRRSMPPDAIQTLAAALPAATTISLQTGGRAGEADALGLINLSPQLPDFAETAALVANLDLVITVDTAIAHLAGALGVPAWLMLPHAPDWRWLDWRWNAGPAETPWYPAMRLICQPEPGDWQSVIRIIVTRLANNRPTRFR